MIVCGLLRSTNQLLKTVMWCSVFIVSNCHVEQSSCSSVPQVQSDFWIESAVAADSAIECPAPQPMRTGLRSETSRGWETSVCEPSPHIPCSFQPHERRHPPEKERGHGSVRQTGGRGDSTSVQRSLKLVIWEKNPKKNPTMKTKKTRRHKSAHRASLIKTQTLGQ